MREKEAIAAMRAGLDISNQPDADYGEHDVEVPATVVFSIDRAKYGSAPPDEPLDVWAFRAVNAAISDLACGGVDVAFAQIDLQIPPDLTEHEVVQIGQGVRSALDRLHVILLNGNNTTSGPLGLATAVHGTRARAPRPPGRAGASAGDWLVCSRLPGRFNSGLGALAADRSDDWVAAALLGGFAELELGRQIVNLELASALIDANDCLLLTTRDLARASDVSIMIDPALIEQEAELVDWRPSIETVLAPPSGDLALVATVPDRNLGALRAVFEELGRRPIILGHCAEGPGTVTIEGFNSSQLDAIAARVWQSEGKVNYPTAAVRKLVDAGARGW